MIDAIFGKYSDMVNAIIEILVWIKLNFYLFPEMLASIFAFLLCIYFYHRKMKIHAGELEDKNIGFSTLFVRMEELNYTAVLVAMDM